MHRSWIYLFPHPPIRDRSERLVHEAFGDMYVYDLNNQMQLKIQKRCHRQIQMIVIYSTCFALKLIQDLTFELKYNGHAHRTIDNLELLLCSICPSIKAQTVRYFFDVS